VAFWLGLAATADRLGWDTVCRVKTTAANATVTNVARRSLGVLARFRMKRDAAPHSLRNSYAGVTGCNRVDLADVVLCRQRSFVICA
jgi:hypothetical protein